VFDQDREPAPPGEEPVFQVGCTTGATYRSDEKTTCEPPYTLMLRSFMREAFENSAFVSQYELRINSANSYEPS
jgi:hypothetical protein